PRAPHLLHLLARAPGERLAEQLDAAARLDTSVRRHVVQDAARCRRLARAGLADEPVDLPGADLQVAVVHGGQPAAVRPVADGEVAHGEHRARGVRHAGHPPLCTVRLMPSDMRLTPTTRMEIASAG